VQRNAPLRELGSFLFNCEARLLFGLGSDDVNGTPKLFAADFYRDLRLTADGDLLDLELMAHARRRGVPIREIPVAGFRRHGGRSTTTLKSAWNMYVGALRLRAELSLHPRSQAPLGKAPPRSSASPPRAEASFFPAATREAELLESAAPSGAWDR
jgi:hypothetical protein